MLTPLGVETMGRKAGRECWGFGLGGAPVVEQSSLRCIIIVVVVVFRRVHVVERGTFIEHIFLVSPWLDTFIYLM